MTDILAPRSKSVRGHPGEDHLLKASKQESRQPGPVGMSTQNPGDVEQSDGNAVQGMTTFSKEYLFIHPQGMDDMTVLAEDVYSLCSTPSRLLKVYKHVVRQETDAKPLLTAFKQ